MNSRINATDKLCIKLKKKKELKFALHFLPSVKSPDLMWNGTYFYYGTYTLQHRQSVLMASLCLCCDISLSESSLLNHSPSFPSISNTPKLNQVCIPYPTWTLNPLWIQVEGFFPDLISYTHFFNHLGGLLGGIGHLCLKLERLIL